LFLWLKNIAKKILPLPIVHAVQQNEVLLAKLSRIENSLKTKNDIANNKTKVIIGTGEMAECAFTHYTRDNLDNVFCFVDLDEGGMAFCGKPVISFEEFIKTHNKHDVIIAVFDVREILPILDDAQIINFTVWQEYFALSAQEHESVVFDKLHELEENDSREKIIYGFELFTDIAYRYYGSSNIYAFADDMNAGVNYMGKQVLHSKQLLTLQDEYDIVVCHKNYDKVSSYFANIKIKNFSESIIMSYYYDKNNDVRLQPAGTNITNPEEYMALKGSIRSPEIINELKNLDFIENPELLNSYNDHLIKLSRRVTGRKNPEAALTATRNIGENFSYGNLEAFADYAGVKANFWDFPAITHGYAILDAYGYPVRLNWKSVLGAGLKIKDIYHGISRDCMYFAVGPFFHYVRPFYNDIEFAKKKKASGRNLTVFPAHTILSHSQTYNEKEFFNKVFEEAKKFDSLTVCTYFTDYNSDIIQQFKAEGAKIVTAGFHHDISFMPRSKSIFMLADAILTNTLGSHVNHALSLNKPVKLISQVIESKGRGHNNDATKTAMENAQAHLQSVLETTDYHITKEQIEAFDPTTGFNLVKSKEEIAALFDLSKHIIETANFKIDKFVSCMRQTYFDLSKATSEKEQMQYKLMKDALPDDYR